MTASFWNLVDNVTGAINRREFREPPEVLPAQQKVRWVPNQNPLPVFDGTYQSLVANVPIALAAIEVDYLISEPTIGDLRADAKQRLEAFTISRVVFAAINEAETQSVRDLYQVIIDQIDNETDPAAVANFDFAAEPWPVGSLSV